MFISTNIKYKVRQDLNLFSGDILESIFIETRINGKNTITGTIYRPPNNKYNEFELELSRILQKIDKVNKSCLLMGDLNIDLLKYGCNDSASRLFEQFSSSHFYPTIYKPTRITPNLATLVDIIFTNDVDKEYTAGLLLKDLSDHLPIFHILREKVNSVHSRMASVVKRVITKSNIEKLQTQLKVINWDDLMKSDDPEESFYTFKEVFTNCIIPVFQRKKTMRQQKSKMKRSPCVLKVFQLV